MSSGSKKVPTFKLSATLSNLIRFTNFGTAERRMNFAAKPIQRCPPHLKHALQYRGTLKFKFSADIQQIWKKTQTNCILSALILIPLCMCNCTLSVFLCCYQNLVLVTEYHGDC